MNHLESVLFNMKIETVLSDGMMNLEDTDKCFDPLIIDSSFTLTKEQQMDNMNHY